MRLEPPNTPQRIIRRARPCGPSASHRSRRNGLRGDQISDIVRLTTIVDIHSALVENRAYRLPYTHNRAFAIMEGMEGKLDKHLLQAFRPVALGKDG